ncbi:hypothetical protein [Sphingomonas faeni]|uniref:hypothetical protein n=1 Tax=Sphingomonas faeni TaxID=185950 RepID=UPI0033451E59
MTARRICTINKSADAGEDGAQFGAADLGDHVIDRRGVQLPSARKLLGNSAAAPARLAEHAADALEHGGRL